MSAFLCSDFHTAVCALAVARHGLSRKDPKSIYSAFRSANNAALMVRYGDAPVPAQFMDLNLVKAAAYLERASVADVAQLLACLSYQCAEGNTLEAHRAGPLIVKADAHFAELSAGKTSHIWSI